MKKKLTILYVVDSVYWITGIMAQEMACRIPEDRSLICSYLVLRKLLDENNGRFPIKVDLVHFLIPAYSNAAHVNFRSESAIVSSILHVEKDGDLLPLGHSDAVMAMSNQWQEHLRDLAPDPDRIVKVGVGIDLQTCRPARNFTEIQKIRKKFGIPADAFVVGFSAKRSSNTSDRKGIDVLEKLILDTTDRNQNIWWAIRGPGWQEWIEPLAQKGARLIYLPFQLPGHALGDSYRMLDAFICTSRIEGGPIPLLEAMATSLPCISTPVGYAIEAIREGENGFFATFGDSDSFYRKISLLEGNRVLARKIANAARDTILQNFTWSMALKKLPELYTIALGNFEKRVDSISSMSPASGSAFSVLKKRIEIENLEFSCAELQRIGAAEGAHHFAIKGILRAPFSWQNIKKFLLWLYAGKPYFALISVKSFIRTKFH